MKRPLIPRFSGGWKTNAIQAWILTMLKSGKSYEASNNKLYLHCWSEGKCLFLQSMEKGKSLCYQIKIYLCVSLCIRWWLSLVLNKSNKVKHFNIQWCDPWEVKEVLPTGFPGMFEIWPFHNSNWEKCLLIEHFRWKTRKTHHNVGTWCMHFPSLVTIRMTERWINNI